MRKFTRRVTLSLLSAGLLAGTASSAQAAAPPATTLPAQYVTATTALLRGTVTTGNQRTLWQFQYGRTTSYGNTTKVQVIPSGRGTVSVSARIGGLRRHTRYHFQLLAEHGKGTVIYYPLIVNFGRDRSFLTRAHGNWGLGATDLVFRGRYAPVSLYCAGVATCKGKLTLTRIQNGHPKTLAKRSITLGPGRYHTFTAKLSSAALKLLKQHHNQIGATLTITPSKPPGKMTQSVTLTRR